MKILFIIDHGKSSGSGHLVRSSQIINQLIAYDHKVYALVENIENLIITNPISNKCEIISEVIDFYQTEFEYFIQLSKKLTTDILVLDSYKIKPEIQSDQSKMKIFRIVDSELEPIDGIKDLELGIRGSSKRSLDSTKIVYPIRNLKAIAEARLGDKFMDQLLIYFGTSPEDDVIEYFIHLVENLTPSVANRIVMYLPLNKIQYYMEKYPLKFTSNIDLVLSKTKMIIGSASSIMYEAAYLNIPMITISLNPSQVNSDQDLDGFGIHLNLNLSDLINGKKLAKLIDLILLNHNFTKIQNTYKDNYEINSAEILANQILGLPSQPSASLVEEAPLEKIYRDAEISDVNQILEWRNRYSVRAKMANSSEIDKIDHYLWWFNNERKNFVIEHNGVKKFYVWFQQITHNNANFLIGGWTPLSENIELSEIYDCIVWQLKKASEDYPSTKWLAVIKKDNIVPNFINSRLGFVVADQGSVDYETALHVFRIKDNPQDFNVLTL